MPKRPGESRIDENLREFLVETFGTGNTLPDDNVVLKGRCFVQLEKLADGLVCKKCYAILSLVDATSVKVKGLAVTYSVKCRNCETVSEASCDTNSDPRVEADIRRKVFKETHLGQRTGIKGRRIIDIKFFAYELLCEWCDAVLSLLDVVKEHRRGFASIFQIPCRVCKKASLVYTDKQHTVGDGVVKHFNVNTSVVGSFLMIGKDKMSMDLYFYHLDVPTMDVEMYLVHEKEVRDLRMKIARNICSPAVENKRLHR